MTIQEYIQNIQESSIADEVKQEIVAILQSSSELDEDTKQKISLLIQKDIEHMLEEDADPETLKELEGADAEMNVKIEEVEKELETGMQEIEGELQEIEQLATELNAVSEDVQIAELKDTLAAQG